MMRTKRKWLIVAVLAAVIILTAGVIGGVSYAQSNGATTNVDPQKSLLGRVAIILGIDQQKVENAFTQAQKEMQDEALDNHLKSLVEQGVITQQQADQYKQWWQSRPDMPGMDKGFPRGFRGMPGPGMNPASALPTATAETH